MASRRRLLLAVAAGVLICDGRPHGQGPDAGSILAAARAALGGEQNLGAVKTFVASGRTRQLRGNNLVPIEFEINCALPDRYVRKDEFPAQDSDVTVTGFRGEELIVFPEPPAGRGGPTPAQRLVAAKQDFARLMLGAWAASFSSFPLTFQYAAEAEAPEGKADVLEVKGPGTFMGRLVVQRDTHLPVMVMWQPPGPPMRGPSPGPSSGGPPASPTPTGGPSPENRLYFADYRDLKGVKWPFRIRRAIGGNTIEETTFDRVTLNVKIDPKKFEAPK